MEGKITAVEYARVHRVPFFGICLGMQMAVVECTRNLCGLKEAHSAEFRQDHEQNVIDLMPGQEEHVETGGTMRLGSYPARLKKGSRIASIYRTTEIVERHRHRYEVMNRFIPVLEEAGMSISGRNPEHDLVETIEFNDHPWFIGCQYHPELQSKPLQPHPLFASFIKSAYEFRKFRLGQEDQEQAKTVQAGNG